MNRSRSAPNMDHTRLVCPPSNEGNVVIGEEQGTSVLAAFEQHGVHFQHFLPLAVEQMVRNFRRTPTGSDPPYAYARVHEDEIERPARPIALPRSDQTH